MENKLTKKDYENILNMLKMKKQFLESCARDYELQQQQIEALLKTLPDEPAVKVTEKEPAESKKN